MDTGRLPSLTESSKYMTLITVFLSHTGGLTEHCLEY
jgi:hypothetical protein